MHDDGAVAEESAGAFEGADVEFEVAMVICEHSTTTRGRKGLGSLRCLEWGTGDIPVFARQITRLALLRCGWVAWWLFAADGGVEVGESTGAAAVRGDRLVVDVVHCVSCQPHSINFHA